MDPNENNQQAQPNPIAPLPAMEIDEGPTMHTEGRPFAEPEQALPPEGAPPEPTQPDFADAAYNAALQNAGDPQQHYTEYNNLVAQQQAPTAPVQPIAPVVPQPTVEDFSGDFSEEAELTPAMLKSMLAQQKREIFQDRDDRERVQQERSEQAHARETYNQGLRNEQTAQNGRIRDYAAQATQGKGLPDGVFEAALATISPFFQAQVNAGVAGAYTAQTTEFIKAINRELKSNAHTTLVGNLQTQQRENIEAVAGVANPATMGTPPPGGESLQNTRLTAMRNSRPGSVADLIDRT